MVNNSSRSVYIIVNAIDPYGYEVNQFLACPKGTKCVVRFKSKWLPTIELPEALTGHSGVLILRDWKSAKLIPLRRLTITSVLPVGEIFDIEWAAEDMIDYDSSPKERNKQIRKFDKHLEAHFGKYENNPKEDFQNLVFTVPADFTKEIHDSEESVPKNEKELHNWGKAVDAIGKLEYYTDIDFLKVIGIKDSTGKSQRLVSENSQGLKRYKLRTSTNYLLKVYQRAFTNKPKGDSSVSPRELFLEADNKAIRIVDDNSPITGKYAGHRFRFKTETLKRKTDTYLRLETKRQDSKQVPPIHIPIRIVTPWWRFALRILSIPVFISGSVALFLSDEWFPNNPSLAKSISILVMVLTSDETKDIIHSSLNKLSLLLSKE